MKASHLIQHLGKGAYRSTRIIVRLLCILGIVVVCAFIYLRLFGVPGPLLDELLRRAHVAGIPVEADRIALTLRGWRAENVRYYSDDPDDLSPAFQSEGVMVSFSKQDDDGAPSRWIITLDASDISIHPAKSWGIDIPAGSACLRLSRMAAVLALFPDRIVLSDGEVDWLGVKFNLDGTVLRKKLAVPVADTKPGAARPVWLSRQKFEMLEKLFLPLSVPGGVAVDIGFTIDPSDWRSNQIEVSALAGEWTYGDIGFSNAELTGSCTGATLHLERMGLFMDRQSIQLSGKYNLQSGEVEAAFHNSLTSSSLLQLMPEHLDGIMEEYGVVIDSLPRIDLSFGPAARTNLFNHMAGEFAIRDAAYMGVEIKTLQGLIERKNNRLEFNNLQGEVRGQESRAVEGDSALRGGTAAGLVFWDGNTREFGVKADVNFDPNLLVEALSFVKIATNIIHRFNFYGEPPRGHLELGANVDDWDTFYIDIAALANDASFEGVSFNSLNVTETYLDGILRLDPIVALQGADFVKGFAVIDFNEDTVRFDARSTVAPANLEDIIYADLDVFGSKIKTAGKVDMNARGIFDWGAMHRTDFTADVSVAQLDLPVASVENFVAKVVGKGTCIAVENAQFDLYGGQGTGGFSLWWDPDRKELPYETRLDFSRIDFRRFLEGTTSAGQVKVSGEMRGNAYVKADFSTNFFAAAVGEGLVVIKNGQLADLPFFDGFSQLMRKVFAGFDFFSITSLEGNFAIKDGAVSSGNAYFEGEVLSAKGRGSYRPAIGFDAYIQAQLMSESVVSKVVRTITDPFMKIFELRLEGPIGKPTWRLEKFTKESSSKTVGKKD